MKPLLLSSSSSLSSVRPPSKPPLPSVYSQDEETLMIRRAIASAKRHGINISHGTPNAADGNCAFESVVSNINDRPCYSESLPFTPDYYRRIWLTDFKNKTSNNTTWNIYSPQQWEEGWRQMMESGVYERDLFGDLMLFGIACGAKKVLLIFNTNLDSPHDPIYVCDPRKFGVEPSSTLPVILAYDMSHYESLLPLTQLDTRRACELVEHYLGGKYEFGRKDLKNLLNTDQLDHSESVSQIDDTGKCSETHEDRPDGAKQFENSLPEHLKGI